MLHDAQRDVRTPTHELTIAHDVLRTRQRISCQFRRLGIVDGWYPKFATEVGQTSTRPALRRRRQAPLGKRPQRIRKRRGLMATRTICPRRLCGARQIGGGDRECQTAEPWRRPRQRSDEALVHGSLKRCISVFDGCAQHGRLFAADGFRASKGHMRLRIEQPRVARLCTNGGRPVVSVPARNRAINDAGTKTLTSDLLGLTGYGHVLGPDDIAIDQLSEEHGRLVSNQFDPVSCRGHPPIMPSRVIVSLRMKRTLPGFP